MRYFIAVLGLSITIGLCWFLDHIRTQAAPLAFGRVLDPFHGFWQNMEKEAIDYQKEIEFEGLKGKVTVHYDERRVPHVFAEHESDLYFAQGYVTARDRLWQMEFQILAASGRLHEFIDNEKLAPVDRKRRRTGMTKAAEVALEKAESNPLTKRILDAYTAGVNAWISSLNFASLPFEYKLLDYEPEPWSNLKSMQLLKMMAWNLTGRTSDFEQTNSFMALGKDSWMELFPQHSDSVSPIVPRNTVWDFEPVKIDTPAAYDPSQLIPKLDYPAPHPNNGSNNWVVAGSKTLSGNPILCNDPHLGLSLPAIWYEIQLSTPDHSVYGVSLPGAPLVIIGFTQDVAWGITNSSRDVLDWYHIEFKDESRQEYRFDGGWEKSTQRIEEIKRRGKASIMDTVLYTRHGPLTYDRNFGDPNGVAPLNIAMRWAGLDASEEIMTFYHLNRAKSYDDYRKALRHFSCPGQNFVFASKQGDIAITQQGRFPAKWPGQGLFVMDGANPQHLWQRYIPYEHNPTSKNPERGFLFSANQHAVDSTYPYRIDGAYDDTRNRRITDALLGMKNITIEDMQKLQNDNLNQLAAEVLPLALQMVDPNTLQEAGRMAWQTLNGWNLMNEPDQEGPSIFEFWCDILHEEIWKDEFMRAGVPCSSPDVYFSLHQIVDTAAFSYADDHRTEEVENQLAILKRAFQMAGEAAQTWKDEEGTDYSWKNVNDITIRHLSRLEPLSHRRVNAGGNHGIVNAAFNNHGPSWRMIVELGDQPNAVGVFPGGQSGNPGNPNFDHMVDDWAAGKYFPLHFLQSAEAEHKAIQFTQTFQSR